MVLLSVRFAAEQRDTRGASVKPGRDHIAAPSSGSSSSDGVRFAFTRSSHEGAVSWSDGAGPRRRRRRRLLLLGGTAILNALAGNAIAGTPTSVYVYDAAGNVTRVADTRSDPENCGAAANVCAPTAHCCDGECATCTDLRKNCTETDVDCGGTCARCSTGKRCAVSGDCASGFCHPLSKVCVLPSCTDGYLNGQETGIDCGGPSCGFCLQPPGAPCWDDDECSSHECYGGLCR